MDNFQSILIIIGIIAIIGVSIHGFLIHRKEKQILIKDSYARDAIASNRKDDGLGNDSLSFQNVDNNSHFEEVDFSSDFDSKEDETIDFDSKKDKVLDFNEEQTTNDTESENEHQALNKEYLKDDLTDNISEQNKLIIDEEIENEGVEQKTDLFIFNVVAKNGGTLGGHELLQYFLTSGFRFGEMSIFHRHEHSDGTGPVLFSIANMMAPGVFDLDSMEQFKSEGVSFFLTAPNANINITKSFKMMLTAVEIMAEEFDCIVLNGEREALTEAQFIEYQDRLAKYN